MNLFPVKPTSRWAFLLVSAGAALASGCGSFLIATAQEWPADSAQAWGWGWGLVFFATGLEISTNAIANERKAYWEFVRAQVEAGIKHAELGQMPRRLDQEVPAQKEIYAPAPGWTGMRMDFENLTPEQNREMARRVANNDASLAYNKLRTLPPTDPDEKQIPDKQITAFRQELKDKGFAIERGRGECIMTGAGKRHFFSIHEFYEKKRRGLLPHPSLSPA